jgi:glyoxylase I family protein
MAILNFSHVGMTCKDPVKVEKFYTKHFGFKRARVYAPGPDQVVMIKAGNNYLELFKAEENTPLDPPKEAGYNFPGWKHICFTVDDLEATLRKMGDEAKITQGPVDMGGFVPGMKVCWVADPEGNIVELNQGYVDEKNPPPLT